MGFRNWTANLLLGPSLPKSVGAANLAAALRDPYLACSPVVALTGGPYHDTRHRHTDKDSTFTF